MAQAVVITDEAFATLLDDIKNYVDITWQDEATDRKLTGIVKRGMAYLCDKAGAKVDFLTEGTARALLMDYTRYGLAAALDEFEHNYLHEILSLSEYYMVEGMKNAEEEAAGYQL